MAKANDPKKAKDDKESFLSRLGIDVELLERSSLGSRFHAAFGGYVTVSLAKISKEFLVAQKKFEDQMDQALFEFARVPLAAAFGAWAIKMESLDSKIVNYCNELYQLKILPIHNNDESLNILQATTLNHIVIINHIRNQRDKSLELRESLVSTYISFVNWLSEVTYNYIKPIVDPDHSKRSGRLIAYTLFIKLLDCLDEKNQLVAKLLYFGGTRTLEEVLGLDIKDVDFKTNYINYRSQLVWYPTHILEDVKTLTKNRKSGSVFLGRQNSPLNPSTIFRNFKEAGSRIGLGDSFSPKLLTTNI